MLFLDNSRNLPLSIIFLFSSVPPFLLFNEVAFIERKIVIIEDNDSRSFIFYRWHLASPLAEARLMLVEFSCP
jgi:hypothetical protein